MRRKSGLLFAIIGLLCLTNIGCQDAPRNDGVRIQAPGVDIDAGPGGARIRAPGVDIDAGAGGARVNAPGTDVEIKR